MSEFLKGNHLNSKLDEILEHAETNLFIISPFIKFHARVKEILNTKKSNDKLQIVIVFGKNEDRKYRSFEKEDFEYLSEFPNVIIKYEPRLHAKYYANESATLLSSMNLYEYSQNNNIEFGIYSKANGILDNLLGTKSLDSDSWEYFRGVVENAEVVYRKRPVYEDRLMGLTKKYIRSEIDVNKSTEIFGERKEKSSMGYQRQATTKPKEKSSGKLLSATALGKTVDKSYNHVVEIMTENGFIKEDSITSKGTDQGLEYKKNAKGDSWIVYPESMKDIL